MKMKLVYPTLVDTIEGHRSTTQREIAPGRWFVAKPYGLPYYSLAQTLRRIFHAWLILRGKAMAVQFAEDRPLSALPPAVNSSSRAKLAETEEQCEPSK